MPRRIMVEVFDKYMVHMMLKYLDPLSKPEPIFEVQSREGVICRCAMGVRLQFPSHNHHA